MLQNYWSIYFVLAMPYTSRRYDSREDIRRQHQEYRFRPRQSILVGPVVDCLMRKVRLNLSLLKMKEERKNVKNEINILIILIITLLVYFVLI